MNTPTPFSSTPLSQFSYVTFLKKLDEPYFVKDVRKKAFSNVSTALLPPTRYGLSIRIEPTFDFGNLQFDIWA